MTDGDPVRELHAQWGGTLKHATRHLDTNKRPTLEWRVLSLQAASFLTDIRPHFRSSRARARADLAIRFQQQKRQGRPSSGTISTYLELQERFFQEMRIFNLRGAAAMGQMAMELELESPRSSQLKLFSVS
jgi:hypothetical protein